MHDSEVWQTLRQETGGRLIAQERDDWGWLHVVDQGDRRYLYFGAPFEQSCILREKPWQLVHDYARAMMLGCVLAEPRDVLMLGLGGGSLLHSVRRGCPEAAVTVVELRPQVAALAREYFELEFLRDEQLIIADAKQQLRRFPPQAFDLLLADLFYDDRMHPWQEQHKFFMQCRNLLRADGWLAINFDSPRLVEGSSGAALFEWFPTVLSVTTRDDNQIVLATLQADFDEEAFEAGIAVLEQRLEVPLLPLLNRLHRHT